MTRSPRLLGSSDEPRGRGCWLTASQHRRVGARAARDEYARAKGRAVGEIAAPRQGSQKHRGVRAGRGGPSAEKGRRQRPGGGVPRRSAGRSVLCSSAAALHLAHLLRKLWRCAA
jgi:hypothetical protein